MLRVLTALPFTLALGTPRDTGARFLSGFPVPVSPPDGVSAVGVPRAIRINPVGIKRVQAALPAG